MRPPGDKVLKERRSPRRRGRMGTSIYPRPAPAVSLHIRRQRRQRRVLVREFLHPELEDRDRCLRLPLHPRGEELRGPRVMRGEFFKHARVLRDPRARALRDERHRHGVAVLHVRRRRLHERSRSLSQRRRLGDAFARMIRRGEEREVSGDELEPAVAVPQPALAEDDRLLASLERGDDRAPLLHRDGDGRRHPARGASRGRREMLFSRIVRRVVLFRPVRVRRRGVLHGGAKRSPSATASTR
eukprot:31185-Pelagococcus_subviridis.AAC.7